MRLHNGYLVLLLGVALTAAVSAAPVIAPPLPTLEGDWEAVIESPRRPWIFFLHLRPAGAGWDGGLSIRGLPEFALRDIRASGTNVHFQFPPELDDLVFDGTWANGQVVGAVLEGGRRTPARLTRVVALPPPANRLEAWRQDLDVAAARLLAYDRSFTPAARRELTQALTRLKTDLPRRNDAEILVALSRAVALADNAHTRLRLDPTAQGSFTTEFPIRFWWFSDGPHVVRASAPYRRALQCRVIAIDGHAISEARSKAAELFAGNAGWADYLSPIYLASPDVLFGLGVTRSLKQASFTLEAAGGERFDLVVRSEVIDRNAMAGESWQELSPLVATGRPPWATALPARSAAVPLYLQHPERPYWFEFLEAGGLLYVQFNQSHNAEEGPSFEEFGASVVAFATQHPPQNVVVDLRLNAGGNLEVAKEFMRKLGDNERIDRPGHLFVIIGHCTFSAGLYHAAQLKQFSHAIFVGEPVGDRLDFWAEGGQIELPNSHAVICYSNGFHGYSGKDHPGRRPYYEELSIPSLAPDIPVPLTSRDYFSGRDPVLEAIVARARE